MTGVEVGDMTAKVDPNTLEILQNIVQRSK
ncbi:MAG: hypothetical protein ACJ72S_18835 [Nitrososphaeraceae archaeon]